MSDPIVAADAPAAGAAFDLESLFRLYDLGGPVVVLLGAMSVAATAIAIAKLLQFRRARVWSGREADRAVDLYLHGDPAAALSALRDVETPVGRAVAAAMRARASVDRTAAREATETAALAEIEGLRGGLRPLEFIAGVAPLLGLFGTVLGMIAAFRALEAAGARVDPSILAGGIWEALFTTAAGLAVAMPALALSNWFDRIVDRTAHRIEVLAGRVLTAEAQGAARAAPPAMAAE